MQRAIPAVVMRGGTSKGLYFKADDLPNDPAQRNRLLLAAMGSPDARQIDGMGGAHPLTSKVAVVSPSVQDDADVDYLFLQVLVDRAEVSDGQNCGNILAGVGPFAIENGMAAVTGPHTEVRIRMVNSGGIAVATVQTPGGAVSYDGDATIDGVPGTAAPVLLDFADVAGGDCGALLPTGHALNTINGVAVTCIDNGMPVVALRAGDIGKTGYESPAELEADDTLQHTIEAIRVQAGTLMNLGDVTPRTVPKMCLLAPAQAGGVICTRTFIPQRVHQAIGVLGAASVAAACRIEGSVATPLLQDKPGPGPAQLAIEHPSGSFTVEIDVANAQGQYTVRRSALLRTARKLMQGAVFVPSFVIPAQVGIQ
ncbi:MAG: 4-oxalomesaconate tautomerase [Gammaproteobacteria bacterium]|nr:4-oxalomesaconate tautomerase [Gammaproteobacteria bacterium]